MLLLANEFFSLFIKKIIFEYEHDLYRFLKDFKVMLNTKKKRHEF
jgi:hypothetical protein